MVLLFYFFYADISILTDFCRVGDKLFKSSIFGRCRANLRLVEGEKGRKRGSRFDKKEKGLSERENHPYPILSLTHFILKTIFSKTLDRHSLLVIQSQCRKNTAREKEDMIMRWKVKDLEELDKHITITFTQPDKVKKIGPGEYLINITISKAERNKALIKDLFRSIRGWCSHDFVTYVWENDTEAPNWVRELCVQYFEEWAVDAKDLSVDKASERTYHRILKYYGM